MIIFGYKINDRTTMISLAVVAVATVVILINMVFAVTTQKGRSVEASALELRSRELRSLEHKGLSSTGAVSLQAASARASQEVEAFKKEKLVKGSELTRVLDEVFKAARRSGLKIKSADYNPVTIKDTDISRYLFSFPVEGNYRQIRRFIYDIENSKRMLVVEGITMHSSKKAAGSIGVEIELSIYFI
ncbi:hypothetical protein MNBD_DELTA01-24 [hydrothermal vent metagenome]|uniref:Type IV pilus biogenesis protein PilO n=1 Tax=hydrothermal vent metagenome TaxID=652676 RepID=A0A3B0RCC9_9ZZZZ